MCECKMCGESKVRVRGFRRTSSTRWAYVNDKGSVWNGAVCPDCRHTYNHGSANKAALLGPANVLNPPKLRRCGDCGVMSPNYYKCPDCTSGAAQAGCYDEDMYSLVQNAGSGSLNSRNGVRY